MSERATLDGTPRPPPPAPDMSLAESNVRSSSIFLRDPTEMAATITIRLGAVMLMQPFALVLYTWPFLVTLIITAVFIVVGHFLD